MSLKESNRFERAPASAPQEVVFPTLVHFRIITEGESFQEAVLAEVLSAYKITTPLLASRTSSAGRYLAYSVSVEIRSRAELYAIDAALKQVPGVRMVL